MSKSNRDKILFFTLYGKLRVSSKKGINKICKGNVFFYKYVHMMIRLQSIHFLIMFLRRHLRAGYITEEGGGGGGKYNQHPFPNPFLYPIFFCILYNLI